MTNGKTKKGSTQKEEESKSESSEDGEGRKERKAKVIAGEVIKSWRSSTRGKRLGGYLILIMFI